MTKIEWTEKTWNPIHGCTKVSEACQNCYAEVMARRLQGNHIKSYENGFKVSRNIDAMKEPYEWKKPTMVFVCSMGDLFHEDVPDTWINPVMRVIEKTPQHTYQILTKRPWRMEEYFLRHPLPKNVWLGTTCENSRHYDRIDALRNVRGNNVKFLSCEPMLGAMNDINLDGIDWVITGGESGPCARRTPIEWFRGLRDACLRWNTPFFFKQWGTWGADGIKRSKKENGSILDGETFKEYPKRKED